MDAHYDEGTLRPKMSLGNSDTVHGNQFGIAPIVLASQSYNMWCCKDQTREDGHHQWTKKENLYKG